MTPKRPANRPSKSGKGSTITKSFRLHPDTVKQLESISKQEKITKTAVIEKAVGNYYNGIHKIKK